MKVFVFEADDYAEKYLCERLYAEENVGFEFWICVDSE